MEALKGVTEYLKRSVLMDQYLTYNNSISQDSLYFTFSRAQGFDSMIIYGHGTACKLIECNPAIDWKTIGMNMATGGS